MIFFLLLSFTFHVRRKILKKLFPQAWPETEAVFHSSGVQRRGCRHTKPTHRLLFRSLPQDDTCCLRTKASLHAPFAPGSDDAVPFSAGSEPENVSLPDLGKFPAPEKTAPLSSLPAYLYSPLLNGLSFRLFSDNMRDWKNSNPMVSFRYNKGTKVPP